MKKLPIDSNRNVQTCVRTHTCLKKCFDVREFFVRRCSSESFVGLPLTLLSLALVAVVFFLGGVIEDYLTRDPLFLVDMRVANLMYIFRSDVLLRFFYFVTLFSEAQVVIVLAIVTSMFFWIKKERVYIYGVWVSLMLGQGLAMLGKSVFQRERPDMFLRAITENSFSFPSGHAATVVPLYGFIIYLIYKSRAGKKTKVWASIFFVALVFLVDLSRLYLGVHYMSDVIAGNLVGLMSLIIAIITTELLILERKKNIKINMGLSHSIIFLCMATIVVSLLFRFSPTPVTKEKVVDTQHIQSTNILSLFDNNILSRFTETLTASPQEPLSLIIVVPRACFVENVARAGWVLADGVSFRTTKAFAKAALLNKQYPTAPMTPSFFNAEPHDYGFQKETEANTIRSRHHARFWNTPYETPLGGVYVGTVSLDTGVKWGILTHRISPDIDTERDLLLGDLKKAGVVTSSELVSFVPPTFGKNFTGDPFFTNGQTQVIVLSSCDNQVVLSGN